MTTPVRFETPENVQVTYHPAGLGTRFSAWTLDAIFVGLITIALAILALVIAAMLGIVVEGIEKKLKSDNPTEPPEIVFYFMGFMVILFQFCSVLYFTLCELYWKGGTVGKRHMRIQVVKTDGFALDAGSILLRNLFRVVDQIPVFWIVPVLSQCGQRFGDMTAGTVVVSTAEEKLSDLRVALLARPAEESLFRFDGTMLSRATPTDVEAAERILERWPKLNDAQRNGLLARVVGPLSGRLGTETPEPAKNREFVEDFLAAVYRREARRLG
jgi:uncharacterized RDD family membrane protein YckC